MKKALKILFFSLVVIVSVGTAFAVINKASFKKNVKMTITVETPEGEVSGSAVREISNESPLIKMGWPHGGNPANVRGEAVVIDLGVRGILFALIEDNDRGRFYQAFPAPNNHPQSDEAMRFFNQLSIGKKSKLSSNEWPSYPIFVHFADIQDTKTIQVVYQKMICKKKGEPEIECEGRKDYYTRVDRFEELFGQGVRIKDIKLEITDEPVTWGNLNKYLGQKHSVGPYVFKRGKYDDNFR